MTSPRQWSRRRGRPGRTDALDPYDVGRSTPRPPFGRSVGKREVAVGGAVFLAALAAWALNGPDGRRVDASIARVANSEPAAAGLVVDDGHRFGVGISSTVVTAGPTSPTARPTSTAAGPTSTVAAAAPPSIENPGLALGYFSDIKRLLGSFPGSPPQSDVEQSARPSAGSVAAAPGGSAPPVSVERPGSSVAPTVTAPTTVGTVTAPPRPVPTTGTSPARPDPPAAPPATNAGPAPTAPAPRPSDPPPAPRPTTSPQPAGPGAPSPDDSDDDGDGDDHGSGHGQGSAPRPESPGNSGGGRPGHGSGSSGRPGPAGDDEHGDEANEADDD